MVSSWRETWIEPSSGRELDAVYEGAVHGQMRSAVVPEVSYLPMKLVHSETKANQGCELRPEQEVGEHVVHETADC